MYRSTSQGGVDLTELRERLRKMRDEELRRFAKACEYMCSPEANMGKPPDQMFVMHLEEAHAEWRRRCSVVRS